MRRIYIDIPSTTPTGGSEALKSIFQDANEALQNEKSAQHANEQIEKRYRAVLQKIMDQLQEDLNPIDIHFHPIHTEVYGTNHVINKNVKGSMILSISFDIEMSGIKEIDTPKSIYLRLPKKDKIGKNAIYNGDPEIFLMRHIRIDSTFDTIVEDFYEEHKEIITDKYKQANK